MTQELIELAACPFCGGDTPWTDSAREQMVHCSDCGATVHISMWNRRALASSSAGVDGEACNRCECFGDSGLHASTFQDQNGEIGCDLCGRPVQDDAADVLSAINGPSPLSVGDEAVERDFAPCPLCKQYSHSIGEDQLAKALMHFESMYAHPVRGHPMGHNFDEQTRDAAQVLMTAARAAIAATPDRWESLFAAIAHGDDEHRAWLEEAIDNYFTGKPVPAPRGKGTPDRWREGVEAREAFLNLIADAIEWEEQPDEGGIYYRLQFTDASLVPLLKALGIEQNYRSIIVDGEHFPGMESPADAIDRALIDQQEPGI